MFGLAALLVGVLILSGAMFKVYATGERAGQAACQAAIAAADKKLADKADELKQEAVNHIDDMGVAFSAGEQSAKARVVVLRAKGAKDVQTNPVFSNPVCVLPVDSLHTLNAARTGFRNTGDAVPSAMPAPAPAASTTVRVPLGKHTR